MGQDFNTADKGRKFSKGGDMATKMFKPSAAVKKSTSARDGVAARGKTKGAMPKMAGNSIGMKSGGKAMCSGGMSKGR